MLSAYRRFAFSRLVPLSILVLSMPSFLPGQATEPEIKVVVLEGEGAINNIRERTARAPVVRIEDDDARPLSGATVTFTLPEFGASGFFPGGQRTLTVPTDREGRTAALGLAPNNVAGQFRIRVSASWRGQSASALITQTNAAPAAVRSTRGRRAMILGLVAGGALTGAIFAARGGGGNGTTPASPGGGTVITPGSPVFGPPR